MSSLCLIGGMLTSGPARAADPEVVASGLQFPEGPVLVGDTLYFVDYGTSDVWRMQDGRAQKVWHQDGCGANGLIPVPAGLLVACYDSGVVVQISLDGKLLETIERDDSGQPFQSPNDLAADAHGGIYFTGSGSGGASGKVYYRDGSGRVRMVASGIRNANGLVVSPDGNRLYLAESGADRLLTLAILPGGALGEPHEFVRLDDVLGQPGRHKFTPDGVRIDAHGNLFVGLYNGGGFAVIGADGKLISRVDLPAAHHASLAFSPDARSVFVTATDDVPGGGYRGVILKVDNPVRE